MTAGPYSIGSDKWPGLSKLIEEAGEVAQVAGKILGAGGAAEHWDGTNLRERLEDEIADLMAACDFVQRRCVLNVRAMQARHDEKLATFERWHREQSASGASFVATAPAHDPVLGDVTLIADSVKDGRCRVVASDGGIYDVAYDALQVREEPIDGGPQQSPVRSHDAAVASRHAEEIIAIQKKATTKIENIASELRKANAELDEARRELRTVRAGGEHVWFWQSDGNEPASLSCPVVMEANTAMRFLSSLRMLASIIDNAIVETAIDRDRLTMSERTALEIAMRETDLDVARARNWLLAAGADNGPSHAAKALERASAKEQARERMKP